MLWISLPSRVRRIIAVFFALGSLAAASITIDYPESGSVFPPEITPPTFLFRDSDKTTTAWRIDISFDDGSPAIRTFSRGAHMRTGQIDADCVAETNRLPELTPEQAAARTWVPGPRMWDLIKKRSTAGRAAITITGLRAGRPVSAGRVTISTSKDPVGAPIFYRDVPLMPTETEKGVIQPLAPYAVRLIKWRLRNIAEPQSRVLMENLPVCVNCHSFSSDGKTLGMDLDGLQNNKGLYTLTAVRPETSIRNENVIQWRSAAGRLKGSLRVGFMSQVSPDGQYVLTTINPLPAGPRGQEPPSNYYVANFKDYRFLQVFFPTRGIVAWYSRATAVLQPLPGADDPRFVQMGAVWSPDSKYVVFARADAREPNPEGSPPAQFANDPAETQIQYDLYRVPFNGGNGGTPEPIQGASRNGMSNTFPKVSPDGRWIIFVQCRNGQLMRPDSQLYIVPASGGQARRMRCNTRLMNSWHSFSPNGRWLVFSSKTRSPYTQMYLTHIDEDGNDSPAILIENATAANRAVNIPEFVSVAPDGFRSIGGPAIEYYRLFDRALYLQKQRRLEESAAEWARVLAIKPDDALAHDNLGMVLLMAGRSNEASTQFRNAKEIKLRGALESGTERAPAYEKLGVLLLEAGRIEEAIAQFRKAIELDANFAPARANLGKALAEKGSVDEAVSQLRKALEIESGHAPAHHGLALLLAARGQADEAIAHWQKALDIDPNYAEAHRSLGDALYARAKMADALAHWRKAVELHPNELPTLRVVAWALATSPDASLRNGSEAVAFAVRAVRLSGGKDPAILDTLAAAYAEMGRFDDAVLTARRALALAPKSGGLAQMLRPRIALYEAGKPFHESISRE